MECGNFVPSSMVIMTEYVMQTTILYGRKILTFKDEMYDFCAQINLVRKVMLHSFVDHTLCAISYRSRSPLQRGHNKQKRKFVKKSVFIP